MLAYAEFADRDLVLEAMFARATELPFGRPDTRAVAAAFEELPEVLGPLAGDRDPSAFAELGRSALHGLVPLHHDGRLLPQHQPQRQAMLVETLAGHGRAR